MRISLIVALLGVSLALAQNDLGASTSAGSDAGFGAASGAQNHAESSADFGLDLHDVRQGNPHLLALNFKAADPFATRTSGGGWLDGPAPVKGARKSPGPAANRVAYLAYQTALSTYVYGVGVPLGLGLDEPKVLIATPLIVAPLAFGAHLASTSRLEFTDAHVAASFYAPTFATYSATALSLAFTTKTVDGYRLGSLIGAGAYPLGLWYGWHLGDQYRNEPERLDNKMFFALGYGFLGFVTPVLYFERPSQHSKQISRIGLGQSVGMAAAGHFISDYYRPSGNSSGVPMGLATHAALGGLGGIAVAAYADASSSVRPWLGAAVIGSTLGFTEGVYFFKDSRDSRERSQYAALGAGGGAMMGLGIQILTYDGDYSAYGHKVSWASYLVGGAWAGYVATYALTGHLTETASRDPRLRRDDINTREPMRWSFNPMPAPEIVMSRGEPASRWKIPGVTDRV
jgi:hypothetical protein